MRKIINSAFVSLDGVTEDPRSWATFDPDSGDEAAQSPSCSCIRDKAVATR